jgi:hypothetical protein
LETVDLWGIHFRSVSHALWFMATMGILLTATFFYMRSAWHGRAPNTAWVKTYTLAHLVTAVIAVWLTSEGTVSTPGFSVDCIWFNSLMALLHLVVFLAFLAHHKYRLRET